MTIVTISLFLSVTFRIDVTLLTFVVGMSEWHVPRVHQGFAVCLQ